MMGLLNTTNTSNKKKMMTISLWFVYIYVSLSSTLDNLNLKVRLKEIFPKLLCFHSKICPTLNLWYRIPIYHQMNVEHVSLLDFLFHVYMSWLVFLFILCVMWKILYIFLFVFHTMFNNFTSCQQNAAEFCKMTSLHKICYPQNSFLHIVLNPQLYYCLNIIHLKTIIP